jgi:gliding motility-associated lipoprotein GldH
MVLSSCTNGVLIDEEFSIENGQWQMKDKKSLELVVSDTSSVYQMNIRVSHTKDYGYQNLYVRMFTTFPSGKNEQSITSLELANRDGSWAGNCSADKCSVMLPLQQRFTFPEIGTYRWEIEPYMRMDTVKGITGMEVICKKTKE